MIKDIRLILNIEVSITEQITPGLISKAINVTNDGKPVTIHQESLDMLQDFIRYISRHKEHHLHCLASELYDILTGQECDYDLRKSLSQKSFDQVLLEAAAEMEPQYKEFINLLFQPDNESKTHPIQDKQVPLSKAQRDILSYILHTCLIAPKITNAKVIPGLKRIREIRLKEEN
jgi:hypothetical protein